MVNYQQFRHAGSLSDSHNTASDSVTESNDKRALTTCILRRFQTQFKQWINMWASSFPKYSNRVLSSTWNAVMYSMDVLYKHFEVWINVHSHALHIGNLSITLLHTHVNYNKWHCSFPKITLLFMTTFNIIIPFFRTKGLKCLFVVVTCDSEKWKYNESCGTTRSCLILLIARL